MEQVASFLKKMDKKPDQELLDIITVQKENYQPDALKAAVMALKTRGVDYRAYIKEFEAEQKQEEIYEMQALANQFALEDEERKLQEQILINRQKDEVFSQDEQTESSNISEEGEKRLLALKQKRNKYRIWSVVLLSLLLASMVLSAVSRGGVSIGLLSLIGTIKMFIRLNTYSRRYKRLKNVKKVRDEVKTNQEVEFAPEILQLAKKAHGLTLPALEKKGTWEPLLTFLDQNLKSKEQAEEMLKALKYIYYMDLIQQIDDFTALKDKHNYLMAPFHKLGIQE